MGRPKKQQNNDRDKEHSQNVLSTPTERWSSSNASQEQQNNIKSNTIPENVSQEEKKKKGRKRDKEQNVEVLEQEAQSLQEENNSKEQKDNENIELNRRSPVLDGLTQEVSQLNLSNNKKSNRGRKSKTENQVSQEKENGQNSKKGRKPKKMENEKQQTKNKKRTKKEQEEDDVPEFQQVNNENKEDTNTNYYKIEEQQEEEDEMIQQLSLEDYKRLLPKNQLNQLKNIDDQIPEIITFEKRKEEDRILPFSHEQILSKFEYVQIFSSRVQQLEQNMEPLVEIRDNKGNFKTIENIVKEEIKKKVLPVVFERKYKNKTKLYNLQDMIILNNHFNEDCSILQIIK